MQESLNYMDWQTTRRSNKLKTMSLQWILRSDHWRHHFFGGNRRKMILRHGVEVEVFLKNLHATTKTWSWVSLHNEPIVGYVRNSCLKCIPENQSQYQHHQQQTNDQTYLVLPGYILKWYFLMRSICSLVAWVERSRMGRSLPSPTRMRLSHLRILKKNLPKHVTFSLREPGFFEDPGWKEVDFLNYESWRPRLVLNLGCWSMLIRDEKTGWWFQLPPLKNISQIGNLPQFSVWK